MRKRARVSEWEEERLLLRELRLIVQQDLVKRKVLEAGERRYVNISGIVSQISRVTLV
jgi:hypothetical protein